MEWLELLFEDVVKLPGVSGVAAADDTGTFISGLNIEDSDEFAAILTFIGRSGLVLEELLGLDSLRYITVSGKKVQLLVRKVQDYFVGIQLDEKSLSAKLELKFNAMIESLDDED